MKILESHSTTAWMLRNDGKAIPIIQHVYANNESLYETLYAAEWLYNNTNLHSTQQACVYLIAAYGKSLRSIHEDIVNAIKEDICKKPYRFLSAKFIDSIKDAIIPADTGSSDIDYLSKLVEKELNQQFTRVRYGGLYSTRQSSRELVFRISSVGFNWYPIIWDFVYDWRHLIGSVTIVRDEESTGMNNHVYRSHTGAMYDRMTVDSFLNERGNPILERLVDKYDRGNKVTESISNNLAEGGGIYKSFQAVSLNWDRLTKKLIQLEKLEHCEELQNYFKENWGNVE